MCYAAGSYQSSISHTVVWICQFQCLNSSLPHLAWLAVSLKDLIDISDK